MRSCLTKYSSGSAFRPTKPDPLGTELGAVERDEPRDELDGEDSMEGE
jgi:hypothetical protein